MPDADKLFDEATGHVMAGEHEEAAKLYRKAIEAEVDHIDAWNGLAGVLFTLKKHEEARDAARELLTHRPKFPDAWFLIGQAEVELKHYPEAIAAFETALGQKEALKPRFKEFWNELKADHAFRKEDGAKELAKKYITD